MRRFALMLAFPAFLAACDGREQTGPRERSHDPIPQGSAPWRGTAPIARQEPPSAAPTLAQLRRGRERYAIFCTVCHGGAGYGDGIVAQKGFPKPPSFHSEALVGLTPDRIVAVITEGRGAMPSMASQIPMADRRAIAFYVKALQLSQNPTSAATPSGGGPR